MEITQNVAVVLIQKMGLANPLSGPFPHEPREGGALEKAMIDHRVFARHGDVFDPMNFEKSRDASSLGDVIVIELLNHFLADVQRQLGPALPPDCVKGIKQIDDVRPLLLIPVWLQSLLKRTCASEDQIKDVKKVWDGLVDRFLALPFVKARDTWVPWQNVDVLAWGLKFSKGVTLRSIARVAEWVKETSIARDKFHKHAMREEAFLNRSARFIVYGHTHNHDVVPLDVYSGSGRSLDQMYVNTGTWRPVQEQAQLSLKDPEFVGFNVMTYVCFYLPDERRGRPFESWSGTLAED